MSKDKPSIEELEEILKAKGNKAIRILPDGSITVGSDLYEYRIQISTGNRMAKWVHELIGAAFHCDFICTEVQATARIDRLKNAGFEIDWIQKRDYQSFEYL